MKILFKMASSLLILIALIGQGLSTVSAEQNEDDIRYLVRSTYSQLNATETVLDAALSQSFNSKLTWIQIFGIIIAADNVSEKLENKEYNAAAMEASIASAELLLSESLKNAVFPISFAYLAQAPIFLSLEKFAKNVNEKALIYQVKKYISARTYGKSHDFIMAGISDDIEVVYFDTQGWLKVVGEDDYTVGYKVQHPSIYDKQQVYGLGLAVFDALQRLPDYDRDRAGLIEDFLEVLSNKEKEQNAIAEVDQMLARLRSLGLDAGLSTEHLGISPNTLAEAQKIYDTILMGRVTKKSDLASMLVDISQLGLRVGLTFELLRPLKKKLGYFYNIAPLEVVVRGKQENIEQFVSSLAFFNKMVFPHTNPILSCKQTSIVKSELVLLIPYLAKKEESNAYRNGFSNLGEIPGLPESRFDCIAAIATPRRKEELESYSLDSLKMVGSMEKGGRLLALLLDSSGNIHRVEIGNHLGQKGGEITGISVDHLKVRELMNDTSGTQQYRVVTLPLTKLR